MSKRTLVLIGSSGGYSVRIIEDHRCIYTFDVYRTFVLICGKTENDKKTIELNAAERENANAIAFMHQGVWRNIEELLKGGEIVWQERRK